MRSKVILFWALIFGSKVVASIPFDEELGQQRAFNSNNLQSNQNTAEQYHGADFARVQSVNAMTNPAQQFPTGQEFIANQGRQHIENYDSIKHPPLIHSLPARNNPANFTSVVNERRKESFVAPGDTYPIRNQHHPIRVDNLFKQQSWQPHNRFENSAASAVDNAATDHERILAVQKPYRNSGQPIQLPAINNQHYQTDNLYPTPKRLLYHPMPQKSGSVRYVTHTGPNSETHTGSVHYEDYHKAHAHNVNLPNAEHNAYVENDPAFSGSPNAQMFEHYNHPSASKILNAAGSYKAPPESINNNNAHVTAINTELNNLNKRYMENPILQSSPNNLHISSGQNLNTYRYVEKPIANSRPNNHVLDAYHAPVVPIKIETILDEVGNSRYIQKPEINYGRNNLAPPDAYNVGPTSNHGAFDLMDDSNKPNYFYNHPAETKTVQYVYYYSGDENVKDFFLTKLKNNFVILYANGTVEHVNNVNTSSDPDYIVVKNDKPLPPSQHPTSDSVLGTNNQKLKILDSLPLKTESFVSSLTLSDYGTNKQVLNDDFNSLPLVPHQPNDNDDHNLSSQSQPNQDTTESSLNESTDADKNPPSGTIDNSNQLLGPWVPHSNNYNLPSEPHQTKHHPYNSHKDSSHLTSPSKLFTNKSSTGTYISSTPTFDDEMIQEFLDSLSNKSDKDWVSSDNNSPHDRNTSDDNSNHSFSQTHTTVLPTKLHTVISPGIFRSTSPITDNSTTQKEQDSHTLTTDSSSILPPSKYDENIQVYGTTPLPLNSVADDNPTESTPLDEIITISPIELVKEKVKHDSTSTPVDTISPISILDEDPKQNDTTTSLSSNPYELQTADNGVDVSTQDTNRETIEKYDTKSACNDYLIITDDPAKFDDNTATSANQNGVNTGDTATGDSSLEIKLSIPNDSDGNLYIKVDAPEAYTGNEDTSNDETLFVTITKQNSTDTDSITAINDTNGHALFNNDKNYDETSPNKNLKLDLSNALVVMNGTSDKDYLNQLLSSDSKVNLFIFQMPCQNQAIVEKSRETTIYPNGTCIEQLTETRWESRDDPSPVIITTKKIYGGGKCN